MGDIGGEQRRSLRIPRDKLWLDGLMVGVLVLLGVALYWVTPEQTQLAPVFDDLALLAGPLEPGVYQDLEFYGWLEQQYAQE
mgnify:CR=1 FL=1